MNAGKDRSAAMDLARENANRDGQPRYVHWYGGVYWIEKTSCQGSESIIPDNHPQPPAHWTRERLDAFLAEHGMKVDGARGGAGKFLDLEVGVGESYARLDALRAKLKGKGIGNPDRLNPLGCDMDITRVNNPDHPKYGCNYLVIHSFWDE
jgi:hypothetical protein